MAQKSYSELKNQLEVVIEKMQDPDVELDEILKLHTEGKKLLTELEAYIAGVKEKVEKAAK